ncbi:1-acyl-sn-glycerol-3-phosphate acyltransferase beta-like isoform X1 [Anneissia japonica]|uniref:1-acyl-sn-glycerol-3-phosphate acyltransferase beta-like isoform X1 n=1 Tax=Anneissia japonica TaxID=1529436 RepID=UPI0014256DCE|nr:1-acyl-sn-glycerol-3-phosphate acyltransferase beta-like isoform X1 [Anneissia japonica]
MDFYQILSVLACLILIIVSFCFVSSTFKFYVKNILLLFWHGYIAVFVAIASLPNPGDQSNMRFWRIFVDFFRTHWMFGIDVNVENGGVLETDKACVVVSNHQDTMDIAASAAFWPPRCTIVAKKSLQYAFTFGIASTLAGAVFVNRRRDPEEARKNVARCVKLLKYHDVKIWMYPEGTRSGNNQIDMLPFKKGAFHMAIQAQVPIVPVVFSYYKHQYNTQLRIFDKVKITARVMEPLPTKGMTEDDVDSLLDTCRNRMLKTFYKISTYLPPTVQSSNNLEVKQSKEKIEQNQNELSRSDEMIDRSTAEDDDRRNFCESG